jgi:hypothetical protein
MKRRDSLSDNYRIWLYLKPRDSAQRVARVINSASIRDRAYSLAPTKMAGALVASSKPATSSRLVAASKYALPVKV